MAKEFRKKREMYTYTDRKEIVEKMINALNDRGYNIDEDTQAEITDELVNILPIHIDNEQEETCYKCGSSFLTNGNGGLWCQDCGQPN